MSLTAWIVLGVLSASATTLDSVFSVLSSGQEGTDAGSCAEALHRGTRDGDELALRLCTATWARNRTALHHIASAELGAGRPGAALFALHIGFAIDNFDIETLALLARAYDAASAPTDAQRARAAAAALTSPAREGDPRRVPPDERLLRRLSERRCRPVDAARAKPHIARSWLPVWSTPPGRVRPSRRGMGGAPDDGLPSSSLTCTGVPEPSVTSTRASARTSLFYQARRSARPASFGTCASGQSIDLLLNQFCGACRPEG